MFKLTSGAIFQLENLPLCTLDHEIALAERKAERWARIFKVPITNYLDKRYVAMVMERIRRNA